LLSSFRRQSCPLFMGWCRLVVRYMSRRSYTEEAMNPPNNRINLTALRAARYPER